ncbi:MAG TPA: hypothetical protein VGJ55_02830 [Pyrinomonadaceae bacterium]
MGLRRTLLIPVVLSLAVAATFLGAAASSPFQTPQPKPPVEARGPIIAMDIASSIDAKGQIVNPTFTFPPNEPEVADIITAKAVFNTPQPTPTPQIGPVTAIITAKGVFEADLNEVNPKPLIAAINQLKATAKCRPPRITFTVEVPIDLSPTSISLELPGARKEALEQYIRSGGLNAVLEPEQYKPDVRAENSSGGPDLGMVDLSFEQFNDQDRDPPQIKLTSKPDAGTCVDADDQIQVTIRASERYEDGHKSWPSGVQMIQLKANGVEVEPTGFWRTPQPCERQTLTVTYKVPSPAPSVVHLEAIVDDAANPTHENSKSLDFPTGTQCKNVMPKNCKYKGYAGVDMLDAALVPGSSSMVSCNFRWSVCGNPYIKTKVVKNGSGQCKSFFDSERAALPKDQYCCDCYPKCGEPKPKPKPRR